MTTQQLHVADLSSLKMRFGTKPMRQTLNAAELDKLGSAVVTLMLGANLMKEAHFGLIVKRVIQDDGSVEVDARFSTVVQAEHEKPLLTRDGMFVPEDVRSSILALIDAALQVGDEEPDLLFALIYCIDEIMALELFVNQRDRALLDA